MNSKFLDNLFLQLTHSNGEYRSVHYAATSFSYFELEEHIGNSSSNIFHIACQEQLSLANQKCSTAHYTCGDGTCILNHYVCDGISNCPDGSSEVRCDICVFMSVTNYSSCFPENCTCSALYFHCFQGGCVPWSRVCDGRPDCPNKEDELNCHFIVDENHSPVNVI